MSEKSEGVSLFIDKRRQFIYKMRGSHAEKK